MTETVELLISDNDFVDIEATYCETLGELTDWLQQINQRTTDIPRSSASTPQLTSLNMATSTQLPAIKIPSFDGDFLNWFQFKDLFISVVKNKLHISNIQKLQYLKDALVGDAANVLDNIATTDAKFAVS